MKRIHLCVLEVKEKAFLLTVICNYLPEEMFFYNQNIYFKGLKNSFCLLPFLRNRKTLPPTAAAIAYTKSSHSNFLLIYVINFESFSIVFHYWFPIKNYHYVCPNRNFVVSDCVCVIFFSFWSLKGKLIMRIFQDNRQHLLN